MIYDPMVSYITQILTVVALIALGAVFKPIAAGLYDTNQTPKLIFYFVAFVVFIVMIASRLDKR